ncbi:MAG: glycoside hydrolase family 3 protein [Chloroflexi bacterium]|nr:glycoside hydrolase family 3 protein [Chloroflexota bacterium]
MTQIATTPARAQSQVDTLLAGLTLEQKVAQMFLVSLYGEQLTEVGRDFLQRYQPGGVVVFEYNVPAEDAPQAVTALINSFQQTTIAAGGLPLLVAVDQEGGMIATLETGFTAFPVPYLVAAAHNPELAYAYGHALAQELRAVGVNMNLAPVADVESTLENPIIRRRAFSGDAALVAQTIVPVIQGMQDAGVLAVAKHFPGHGATTQDSHTELPMLDLSLEQLAQRELVPFEAAIEANVSSIMMAHIWFPALEPTPNTPASLSPAIIEGLLRTQLGYDGLVITDALDMDAIDLTYTAGEAALRAVQAGVDLLALGPHMGLQAQQDALQAVINAVRTGEVAEARIDDSVRRILAAKQMYGLLDWQPLDPDTVGARLYLAAHAQLVDALFAAGITLAYDSAALLPLEAGARITLIYPGSRPQIERECRVYNQGFNALAVAASPTQTDIDFARDAAARSDALVVFTQDADYDGQQQALVRALPLAQTVVVALASPYDARAFPEIAAYLITYSPLPPAVPAACAVLFGAAPAPGQLVVNLLEALP